MVSDEAESSEYEVDVSKLSKLTGSKEFEFGFLAVLGVAGGSECSECSVGAGVAGWISEISNGGVRGWFRLLSDPERLRRA